jgi:hypothetical protein
MGSRSNAALTGRQPFGGKHDYDKLLLTPAYAAYKIHLDQGWKAIAQDQNVHWKKHR